MSSAWNLEKLVSTETEDEVAVRAHTTFMNDEEVQNCHKIPTMIARAAKIASIELDDGEIEPDVELKIK